MDGTRLLVCFIVMSFCSLSKQDEDFGKQKSAGQEVEGVCEPDWTQYKNHCYKLNSDEVKWEYAKKSCNDGGASLVYIEDSEENKWLGGLCPDLCWIGINDRKQEKHWVWSHDMTTNNFTVWIEGEPNNQDNEDCGVLYGINHTDNNKERTFKWNDLPCYFTKKFICKKTTQMGFIQSVNIKGNGTFSLHEGEDMKIECEAEAVSVTGKVDFSWTLNGYLVRPTRSSRIKITYSKTEAVRHVSTLHISNFMQSDEGNCTCTAFIGNARKDVNAAVIMHRFTLESSNTAAKKGANITATCTVYPETEFANNSLKLCIDSKLVDAVDNAKIRYDKNKAVLTKASLTRDISITCGFIAKEQCSQHKEIRIAVFEPEYFPCPTQTDEKHLTWPETFPGLTATIKCLPGFTGMISRTCRKDGYNGTWLDPSFTNCTREEIAEIEKKLNRIKDGVGVDKLVNVIREFRNTSENIVQTNLTASDIRAGVQVLATVSEIVTSREENITVEETEEFFYATDVLLSGECKESWQDLYNETKDNGAARVMDIVGDISNRAMENLVVDKPISINGKNIVLPLLLNVDSITTEVLLIENTNISSIAFPKNKTSDITSEVELSEETIKNSLKVNSSVRYSAAYYKTLGDFLPNSYGKEELGSTILAFSLPSSDILRQLDPPIRMTFKTKETDLIGRLCSYWDQKKGVWAGDGCWATAVNETFTECKCNHLTNFAVLISLKEISQDHHKAMSLISLVGFIASIVFLIVTVAVYIHYWRYLKSDKALILMIMCIILILAYLTFMIGIENTQNKNTCTALAVTLHYLFLVFVCLMATEGIIHTVMVVCRFQQTQSINRFLIPMSFGVPLVIVAVSVAITQLDGYGTDKLLVCGSCWLDTKNGLIYSFLGPCYAVVIMNLVITGLLFKKLYSTKATMNKSRRDKIRTGIRSLLILAPVFGLTWLLGFFYIHDDAVAFAYLFVIFNSLQGLLIFIMHTFMNQTVKKRMTRTICKLRKKKETASTSDSSITKKKFFQIRDKASTDNKFTADGAGLKSSTSDSTYELKMNDVNSVKDEYRVKIGRTEQREKKFSRSIVSTSWNIFKKNKMTYRVQRNLQTNDEDSVVFNPTYRMISIEETCVTTF